MSFLSDVFVAILSGYLALTNGLASWLAPTPSLPSPPPAAPLETHAEAPAEPLVQALDSSYERGGSIPDILLRNAEYQLASIAEAVDGVSGSGTSDVLDAVVNIFCTYKTDAGVRATTGTGFFISPSGVIATNAHVGQFLLFNEMASSSNECVVRTGNPAVATYEVELLYLPPSWLIAHAALIDEERPQGTGERDYALLLVTRTLDSEPLPARFPFLQTDTDYLLNTSTGADVLAAGYPAETLVSNGPDAALIPVLAEATITELFTFGSQKADVMGLSGSALGEHGASGGPVLDEAGNVVGLIVTKGDDESDGAGSLRAITFAHINDTIKEETGGSLSENLSGDLALRSSVFQKTMQPFLARILARELE